MSASLALDLYRSGLPRKPYCTDDLSSGLRILPLSAAVRRRYLQGSGPALASVLVFDIDRPVIDRSSWEPVWESSSLPVPNLAAITPSSGRGHLFYFLSAPVCRTDAAHLAPLRYLAAVQSAYTAALDADPGYSGLISKNPLHPDWHVWDIHGSPYSLAELACHVDLSQPANRYTVTEPSEAFALGRNVALFDLGRKWAYSAIRGYWAPNGLSRWRDAVQEQLEAINGLFSEPLPPSEVKASAKSIAKWTWKRFTPGDLAMLIETTHSPEKQAERGRLSGAARRAAKEKHRDAARVLRDSGYSTRRIAAVLGVDHSTVVRWLRSLASSGVVHEPISDNSRRGAR